MWTTTQEAAFTKLKYQLKSKVKVFLQSNAAAPQNLLMTQIFMILVQNVANNNKMGNIN